MSIAHPYQPLTPKDRDEMLEAIGVATLEDLFSDIPEDVRLHSPLNLPQGLSELEVTRHLEALSKRCPGSEFISFLGGGAGDHFIPAVVGHVLSKAEFATAYTPYQAEISQGNLQAIYEYQSMICALTGMDVANASMYDGATALAEAAVLAAHTTGRSAVVVAENIHPYYRDVLQTYCSGPGIEVRSCPFNRTTGHLEKAALGALLQDTAGLLLAQPSFFGTVEDLRPLVEQAHGAGALVAVSAHPLSLGLLAPPGEVGADIATGEGQSLGLGQSFGGPYVGFFATTQALLRRLPGRLVGLTRDARDRRGFTLTLQAREQHIRRERATSNICTNQALAALGTAVYMAAMGPQGIREAAQLSLQNAAYAKEKISGLKGCRSLFSSQTFHEFVVELPIPATQAVQALTERGILAGLSLGRWWKELEGALLISVSEKRTKAEIDALARALEELS